MPRQNNQRRLSEATSPGPVASFETPAASACCNGVADLSADAPAALELPIFGSLRVVARMIGGVLGAVAVGSDGTEIPLTTLYELNDGDARPEDVPERTLLRELHGAYRCWILLDGVWTLAAVGAQGPQGIQGAAGETGIQGAQGITGEPGVQGVAGEVGDTGTQGIQGLVGETGLQGIQGAAGEAGAQGIQGIAGDPGVQGVAGETGDTGPQGIQGLVGETGEQGVPGADGANAASVTEWISGGFIGAVGVVRTYYGPGGQPLATVNSLTGFAWPVTGARTFSMLRVTPKTNAVATATAFTLYKNGVATALTVTIPAGSTGTVTDSIHSIAFVDGDTWDLVALSTGGGALNALTFVCSLISG